MFSYLNPIPYLPEYAGPYKVGTTEFEIPVSEISSTSTVPDTRISTIKFRLFYPTSQESGSQKPVYWLPNPQNKWVEAYASFMGASSRFSTVVANFPSLLNWITIPAVKDALLLPPDSTSWPVCIFSHGLGGNCNTYSSIVGSLASCGVVCVAPEHRDGSATVSFIKNAEGKIVVTIEYEKISHSLSTEVLNARNEQLRIRLWELELTYAVISAMNEGKSFTNYAESIEFRPGLEKQLLLEPGKVCWAGHSFGAATTTQFVKSVFYHQHLPEVDEDADGQWNRTPLYQTTSGSDLVQQITAESPVALLDLWTMPLRSETTKWLWEKPMPCYARNSTISTNEKPNTIAIMSAEFHKWTEMLNRTRALLSWSPVEAIDMFSKKLIGTEAEEVDQDGQEISSPPIAELSKRDPPSPPSSSASSRDSSPTRSIMSSDSEVASPASSMSSLPLSEADDEHEAVKEAQVDAPYEPHLYLVSQSAHLSQSDFGPLFPSLVKYVMKAIGPEKTVELNVRAMAGLLKGCGLPVKSLISGDEFILDGSDQVKESRWIRLSLVDS